MQQWKWDIRYSNRFNPMDDAKDKIPHIAMIQAINSLREFTTGITGERVMSNSEFAEVLGVALSIAMAQDD